MSATKKIQFGGIWLDTINSSDPLVPTESIHVTTTTAVKKALGLAIANNYPTLLIGETGTGKTSLIKRLAHIRKQPYVRVNMTGFTTPDELIGSKSVKDGKTYYENGIITDAMIRGAILVLDEINSTSPDCLFILHGLLDEDKRVTLPNGDIITPHKDFRVFATANPEYEGTKTMNKAFLDRFPIILTIDTLNPKQEIELLQERTQIPEDVCTNIVAFATKTREMFVESKISTFISTRSLLSFCNLIKNGLDIRKAFDISIKQKTTDKTEQTILTDCLLSVLKVPENTDGQTEKFVFIRVADIAQKTDTITTLQASNRELSEIVKSKMGALEELEKKLFDSTEREKTLVSEIESLKKSLQEQEKQLNAFTILKEVMRESMTRVEQTEHEATQQPTL